MVLRQANRSRPAAARPDRARSRARRSCTATRCVAPTPLASTVTRAPASREAHRGDETGEAGADDDDVVMAHAARAPQVLHVEQPLEDPVVEPRLAQLVAVQDRPHALPALLQEAAQRRGRLGAVEPVDRVQDPGRAVDAEAALARAHAEPQRRAGRRRGSSCRGAASSPRACCGRSARTRRSAARPASSPRAGAAASRASRAARRRCRAGCTVVGACTAARRRAACTSRRRCPAPSAAASSACRPTSSGSRPTPSRSA